MKVRFINFIQNEITDVIFLSNTADKETFQMTSDAIDSLRKSESNNKFRIILVESNSNNPPAYDVDISIAYSGDFNYNRALNMAFEHVVSDYVCVFNNDVYFKENWYSEIRYHMDAFSLDSASPLCPVPQVGPSPMAQKMILEYPAASVIIGYEPIVHFCGWGWIMKKEALDLLRPMPEELKFWFQDNHMAIQLRKFNKKHGCVTSSHVIHFGQKSYRYIEPENLHSMTHGLQETFLKKYKVS
jgi:glycosyltransferase involved in cell wall biosynthesis